MYKSWVKRPLDFILALIAIIALSPLFLFIAWLVKVKLGSPVIFKQNRVGLDDRIFTMYKFRSMTDERDENGELLSNEIRLTKFGKTLRSTSLDELPELLNVLFGHMSTVGPRPLLPKYLPHYSKKHRRRHSVRPGITGLAQVKGRNALSWDETLDFDVEYAEKVTFLSDIKIIFSTVGIVLGRKGINSQGDKLRESFIKPIIIIGAGGHGKSVCNVVVQSGFTVLGFLDDNPKAQSVLGFPVLGSIDKVYDYKDKAKFIIGVGDSQIRKKLAERLEGMRLHTAIHPSAVIGLDVTIGEGSAVMPNAVINPQTTVGNHSIINTSAVIEHDNNIGSFVHISPNAATAGNVTIGDLCHVGIGASIKEGIAIAPKCIIGAGAAVVKDTEQGGSYVGVPANIKV